MDTARHWKERLARLIQPRQPESGTIRLDRRRIYILPTRTGLLYGAALLVMLIGAINYDLALGHALVFLLASLGLVAMLHTHRNLLGLEISVRASDPVHAGDPAHCVLSIRNTQLRPHPALEWTIRGVALPPVVIDLAAGASGTVDLAIPTSRRGWQTLPPLKLASRYPLGLLLAWAHPWPQSRCLVYPAPRFTPLPQGGGAGFTGTRQGKEGQEDFAGLRERQPADSPRHIAWKAAARDMGHRPLQVKVFAGGAQEQLWLDWLQTEGDTEQRLSTLAGWVLDAEGAGIDYGLRLPGQTIPPGHGAAQRHRCLESLALHP